MFWHHRDPLHAFCNRLHTLAAVSFTLDCTSHRLILLMLFLGLSQCCLQPGCVLNIAAGTGVPVVALGG
jgi:hypothetical protein